ncbi:MAG: RNA polymerase sigma factor [Nonlabens sp.]|uniref:RNA polymerase sigma factor n=1 Tax=Nonlabens sp. TaxID=1888209 RepID=UPI003EF31E2D
MSLENLIKACKKQDRKAQAQLYHHFKDTMMVQSLKYSRNREQAQDNLHDAFIAIFQNIDRYKGKGSFEGWMKRIVINKAITLYKKESFMNVLVNEEITEDVTVDTEVLDEIKLPELLKLIQELPDRYRLVFSLYELDDYSHQEIATIMNISIGTSKSNLHRAKVLLKQSINDVRQARLSNSRINGNS